MAEIFELVKNVINPEWILHHGGIWFLLLIIFAETGLFVGFFLPGDSLLFVAGIYSSMLVEDLLKAMGMSSVTNEYVNLFVLILLVTLAGIAGNITGYWFGKKIGPAMFNWKDRFLFKQKYLHDAKDFYDQYGGSALVFARFLPIIRTFAPIVAGIVQMDKAKFSFFNIVGCIAWVVTMILAGHFLQIWMWNQFGYDLKKHLEIIVIVIILVTTLPVLYKLFTGKMKTSNESN